MSDNKNSEFTNQVVNVTGACRRPERCHAIEFGKRGAKVLVNDSCRAVDGTATDNTAQPLDDGIVQLGGIALPNIASVTSEESAASLVEDAVNHFGTIDKVVNNAGILCNKTFTNVTMNNFRALLDVHLMDSVDVTKAT